MRERDDKGGRRIPRKGVTPRFTCHSSCGNWYIQDQAEQTIIAMCTRQDAAMLLTAAANDFVGRTAAGAASLSMMIDNLKQAATAAAGKTTR